MGLAAIIDLEARASAAVAYRRRLSESPHCAQRAPHLPPPAARPTPAPTRAQSRGRAWGWRHSAPWSSASPCSSPAETDDALFRLPERVAVPRDSTGSSAPNSLSRHAAGSVASTVILGTGKGRRRSAPDSSPSALPCPGNQLIGRSTARCHLDVLTPMHAESSSVCTVMGTGVEKATLGAGV